MQKRFTRFVFSLLTILIIMYWFLSTQLIAFTDLDNKVKVILYIIFGLPFIQVAWLPLVYWWLEDNQIKPRHKFMSKIAYFWMGFMSLLLFFIAMRALILMPTWYFLKLSLPLFGWEYSIITLFGSVFIFGYGYIKAKGMPNVEIVEIPFRNVKSVSKHIKIAQISDLHISENLSHHYIENIVNVTNSLEADFIVLTGDIGDGSVESLKEKVLILKKLKARYQVFYVPGNHECYWGVKEWIQIIESMKMIPLINEHKVFNFDQFKIAIAGVPDIWNDRFEGNVKSDPIKAIANCPEDVQFKILLAHQPQTYKTAIEAGFDLQLSGHTHAGQFIPWSLIIRLFHRFARGLYQYKKMWIYVNRGTGHWGPPLRVLASPEVTLIKIV